MKDRFENPLKGKPYTKETRDAAGKLQYEILPNTLTPLRAKVADKLTSLLTVLIALLYIFSSIYCWRGYEELFWQVVVFLLFYFFGQDAVRDLFYKKSRITMTAEEIVVGFWVFKKHYRRNLEHRFSLLTHDRARDEQRQANIKAQKLSKSGKIMEDFPYYGESFHVALIYAGQRCDLLTVLGHKESVAIVERLQYCDRMLNDESGMGGGVRPTPADEWKKVPGGLDDE